VGVGVEGAGVGSTGPEEEATTVAEEVADVSVTAA